MTPQLKKQFIEINKTSYNIKYELQNMIDNIKKIEKLKLLKNKQTYVNNINKINELLKELININENEYNDVKIKGI